jgi:integrase
MDGKRRHYKLGVYGKEYLLSEARGDCREARKLIAQGVDPQMERDQRSAEQAESRRQNERERKQAEQAEQAEQAVSVNAVLDHYLNNISPSTKVDAENIFTNRYSNIRKTIGQQKIREITPEQLKSLVNAHKVRGKLRTAGKAYGYLKAAFNRAEVDEDDMFLLEGWDNPFVRYRKPRGTNSKPVDRYLSTDEIKVLWGMLDKESTGEAISKILKIILLTGQRVEQVSRMQWAHLNLSEQAWELPAVETKVGKRSGRTHVVPLCPMVLDVVESVSLIDGEPFLFPGKGSGSHNTQGDVRYKPLYLGSIPARVRKSLAVTGEIERFTPRDLRRTVTTHMSRLGIDSETRNRVQDHAIGGIEEVHYNKYDHFREKRGALLRWESEIQRIIGQHQPAEVVQHHG